MINSNPWKQVHFEFYYTILLKLQNWMMKFYTSKSSTGREKNTINATKKLENELSWNLFTLLESQHTMYARNAVWIRVAAISSTGMPRALALAKLLDCCLPECFFHLKTLDFEDAEDPCLKNEGTSEVVYMILTKDINQR